jgi:hypothetical protein
VVCGVLSGGTGGIVVFDMFCSDFSSLDYV